MNASEVNSRLMGCTVQIVAQGRAIEVVVLGFTTGEVPELFVRWENGSTSWERAEPWLVAPGANEPNAPTGDRMAVPRISYVQKERQAAV